MIDIETMGNTAGSAIVSIAAVQFDLETGKMGLMYEEHVSLESCLKAGLSPNASTILWWLQQDEAARKELVVGQTKARSLRNVLSSFQLWIETTHKDPIVWGNSARFDLGILESAFAACNIPLPWKFWNERCVRTLAELAPEIKRKTKFQGVAHHAIDDCVHQVRYTVATYRKLKGLPEVEIKQPEPVASVFSDDELPF
jgi:DNA polymerase III epsilon subunit-like protein